MPKNYDYQEPEMIDQEDIHTQIQFAGPLNGGLEDPHVWSGKISVDAKPTVYTSEFRAQNLDRYFYQTSPVGPERCIDGRPAKTSLGETDSQLETAQLGPQVSGGTPALALALRLAKPEPVAPEATLVTDIAELQHAYKELELPFPCGAHSDTTSSFPNTGCGAIDKMIPVLEKIADTNARTPLENYCRIIMAGDFDSDSFLRVRTRAASITAPANVESYFDKHGEVFLYKTQSLECVAKGSGKDAVEIMDGKHKEALAMINKTAGTTFNRDLFCKNSSNQIQAFNFDYWHVLDRANSLFPGKPAQRTDFITASTTFAVATAMVLTDGSLEVAIRQ